MSFWLTWIRHCPSVDTGKGINAGPVFDTLGFVLRGGVIYPGHQRRLSRNLEGEKSAG
jgi:hypothetical protein